MADKSHFHECPICGQSFGEAVFETHVDLCIKQSFIKDAAKAPAIFNSSQLADQVADIEARLFSFLDNLEGSPPDIRCDIDTQKSTRHLHNSLVNARRRLCQIYERLGVEFENGSHAILVQPAKGDGQHMPVPHRPLPAPPRQLPSPPAQPPAQSQSQSQSQAAGAGAAAVDQKDDYVMVNAPAPPIPPRLGEIGSRTLHSVSMSSLRSAISFAPGADADPEEKGRSASSTLSGALTTMEERLFAEFMRKEGTCSVCRQVKGPEVVLVMEKCDHRVCPDCLATFLRRALKAAEPSGKLSPMDLTCPASSKCRHRVSDWMCKRVLPAEEYEALEKATLKSFIDSSNLVTCPNPKCGQVFEPVAGNVDAQNQEQVGSDGKPLSQEAKEHRAKYRFRCQMCQTIFCSQCAANPYHLGYSCDQWKVYQEAKHCRFCSTALTPSNTAPVTSAGAVPNVCTLPECLAKRDKSCLKTLRCGHACGGIANEGRCLPCLEDGCKSKDPSGSKEDYCNICWIESIGSAPSIQLGCGHIFHWQCVLDKIQRKWAGARIAFGFLNCPLCKKQMAHPALDTVMRPYLELFNKVQEKAVHRLKVEALDKDKRLSEPGGKYLNKPALYAMDIFAYYICFKCQDPYFGGRRACEEAAREDDAKYDPKELVCGSCSSGGDTTKCKTHGKDYIEFKCKWCCDIATYFCWGTTHFCAACHKRQEQGDYLTKKPRSALPVCPGKALCKLGVDHPPNGEEYALGCAICRHLN